MDGTQKKSRAIDRLYPELRAGGYARHDHRIAFFSRVNALLSEGDTVLDFGAGRGHWGDLRDTYAFRLRNLRATGQKVIGVDVDEAVMENPFVDESHIVGIGEKIPLPDNSVDLVYAYAVFEHVANPEFVAAELERVVKPGGWICAWTPNRRGYVATVARLVPNSLHVKVLTKIGMIGQRVGQREAHDVFPTVYRMNTVGDVARQFAGCDNCSFVASGPEGYAGRSMLLARLMRLYNWLLPASFGTHLYVFLRKR